MLCEMCGAAEAVVHLTQVINNKMTTLHLCERCAAEQGLQAGPSLSSAPLADLLASLGGSGSVAEGSTRDDGPCPFCALEASRFKEVGRLGCPQCYTAFEGYLRGLLRRIHGGTQHRGKVYLPPDPASSEREQRLAALRRSLDRAVLNEDFERAASLRDQIRALDSSR
jgi:protein arginine kinase activator